MGLISNQLRAGLLKNVNEKLPQNLCIFSLIFYQNDILTVLSKQALNLHCASEGKITYFSIFARNPSQLKYR